jgi:hypothetical protein
MATTQRRSSIRRAFSVGAVAVAATVLGASSPIASAAAIGASSASSVSTLDTPANWAVVKAAAASGYFVPDKYAASCGAKQ